jgi:NTP pyrophosphatase (non-canonical NTP hydrolase)
VRHNEKGKPEGFPVELADILIRVLDLAGRMDIDLDAVVAEKMRYNAGREYLHGKKA